MKNFISSEPDAFNNRTYTWVNRAGGDIHKYIQGKAIREHNVPD